MQISKRCAEFLAICSKQSHTGTTQKGYLTDHFTAHPDDLLIILSRTADDETSTPTQSIKNGEVFQHPHLDIDIQIIPQAVHAVRQSCMARIVILSTDIDVFVVAMYFYHFWQHMY